MFLTLARFCQYKAFIFKPKGSFKSFCSAYTNIKTHILTSDNLFISGSDLIQFYSSNKSPVDISFTIANKCNKETN